MRWGVVGTAFAELGGFGSACVAPTCFTGGCEGAAATPPIRLAEMSQPEFVVSEGTSNALLTVVIKVHPKEITVNWDELPADAQEAQNALEGLRQEAESTLCKALTFWVHQLTVSGSEAACMALRGEEEDEVYYCNQVYYYVLVTSKDPKQLCNRQKTFKASLGKCGLTPEWIRPLTTHLQRVIGFGHANLTKDEFQQACSNVANVQQASEL